MHYEVHNTLFGYLGRAKRRAGARLIVNDFLKYEPGRFQGRYPGESFKIVPVKEKNE